MEDPGVTPKQGDIAACMFFHTLVSDTRRFDDRNAAVLPSFLAHFFASHAMSVPCNRSWHQFPPSHCLISCLLFRLVWYGASLFLISFSILVSILMKVSKHILSLDVIT